MVEARPNDYAMQSCGDITRQRSGRDEEMAEDTGMDGTPTAVDMEAVRREELAQLREMGYRRWGTVDGVP